MIIKNFIQLFLNFVLIDELLIFLTINNKENLACVQEKYFTIHWLVLLGGCALEEKTTMPVALHQGKNLFIDQTLE